ncbi:hypothetical protein PHAGE6E_132 [Staphylococcus phage 6ec]|uniref:Uncharacterized protein n=1 Tax=Staphylococcus phage 6ec TaxID=1500386 RepID=A0A060AL25_9CAUD|nr:hypothetical protein PHAGE6E_132 [Staphylococcus phage 6ec]AIA64158.1 hypothetical protein PHAGE6E_132 [Staphylococcus phage 6ec]
MKMMDSLHLIANIHMINSNNMNLLQAHIIKIILDFENQSDIIDIKKYKKMK